MTTGRINQVAIHTQAISLSLVTYMRQVSRELSYGSHTRDACGSLSQPWASSQSVRFLCQASYQQTTAVGMTPISEACLFCFPWRKLRHPPCTAKVC